jgi:hypothetical protein
MARKPTARTEFVMFDVVYEDGTQRSNRKVDAGLLGGLDGDEPAKTAIMDQDRAISEKSGVPPLAIKSINCVLGLSFSFRGCLRWGGASSPFQAA